MWPNLHFLFYSSYNFPVTFSCLLFLILKFGIPWPSSFSLSLYRYFTNPRFHHPRPFVLWYSFVYFFLRLLPWFYKSGQLNLFTTVILCFFSRVHLLVTFPCFIQTDLSWTNSLSSYYTSHPSIVKFYVNTMNPCFSLDVHA